MAVAQWPSTCAPAEGLQVRVSRGGRGKTRLFGPRALQGGPSCRFEFLSKGHLLMPICLSACPSIPLSEQEASRGGKRLELSLSLSLLFLLSTSIRLGWVPLPSSMAPPTSQCCTQGQGSHIQMGRKCVRKRSCCPGRGSIQRDQLESSAGQIIIINFIYILPFHARLKTAPIQITSSPRPPFACL